MAFYIRKMAEGRSLWLKRLGPAIIWGPKSQALNFATKGVARLMLQNIPKTDKAEILSEEEAGSDS